MFCRKSFASFTLSNCSPLLLWAVVNITSANDKSSTFCFSSCRIMSTRSVQWFWHIYEKGRERERERGRERGRKGGREGGRGERER